MNVLNFFLGKIMPDVRTFISSLTEGKVMFNKEADKEVYRIIEDKTSLHNVIALYQLSQVFKSSNKRKSPIFFFERYFPIVSESQNFLYLDYKCVAKIMSSSYLNIDSELEVFNAIVSWLGNKKERYTYAKHLFLKVRLTLLSVPVLRFISEKIPSFIDSLAFIKEIIDDKSKGFYRRNFKADGRFCDQDKFKIIVCGGTKNNRVIRDVYGIKPDNISNVKRLPQLKEKRKWSELVCIKDEIFVFGGYDDNLKSMMSIEKYSSNTKAWKIIRFMPDERVGFCVCSFMGNAYVLGGFVQGRQVASCFKFKATDYSMNTVAKMKTARSYSACAVFEGKIVVSGGYNFGRLNTVEAFDHVANEWTRMPNMVEERQSHKSVAIKNKLYMFGGLINTCEVYDSTCEKFVLLKQPTNCFSRQLHVPNAVISIGNKLIIFQKRNDISIIFDVENNTWSKEPCEFLENLSNFSCVKVLQY